MGSALASCHGLDVRWATILKLQEIMSRVSPGSRKFRIADKAIEFALSPRRIPARIDHFMRNVWRNAAHSVARSDQDQKEVLLDSSSPESMNFETPEDITSGNELKSLISELSEQVAPGRGAACVRGLMSKDTIGETAADLLVSPKTIKRVRKKIRTIASEVIREAA